MEENSGEVVEGLKNLENLGEVVEEVAALLDYHTVMNTVKVDSTQVAVSSEYFAAL